jgi:predicted short-subunit dehydrogenase-like oxidoreductase (DUF2520 family)
MTFHHIGIVGAGNLAWHLITLFYQKGVNLTVYARNAEALQSLLVEFPRINIVVLHQETTIEGDLIFLAVKDDAFESFYTYHFKPSAYVVHLSGARSLQAITSIKCAGVGVIYPFQTFTYGRAVYWKQVPIFVEAITEDLQALLIQFLLELQLTAYHADLDTRKHVHLSGVLVNNFVYHLFNEAAGILAQKGIDKKILSPIIAETVSKFFELEDSRLGQSGPAVRKDFKTIGKHMEMLEKFPNLKTAYEELTKSILNT